MNPSSRTEAQQRADQIRVFEAELERLRQDGVLILTEQQQSAIAEHHSTLLAQYAQAFDIDRDVKAKQLSIGMRIASFLGALALAASVFFLFYQFWGLLSTAAQVAVLLAASLSAFGATMWMQSRDGTGYFTKPAAMVAFVSFVLNIAMLGQIFNITPSDKALVAWTAFALLLATSIRVHRVWASNFPLAVTHSGTPASPPRSPPAPPSSRNSAPAPSR